MSISPLDQCYPNVTIEVENCYCYLFAFNVSAILAILFQFGLISGSFVSVATTRSLPGLRSAEASIHASSLSMVAASMISV